MADSTLRFRDRRVLENYLKDISKFPLISAEKERELARKIKKGDQKAFRQLVEANLRYVISVANTYAGYGMPLEDLINEGNMGLIEAAKRFDETRGFKFISYAVWWIRQAILTAIASQSRIIKIPMNRQTMLQKIHRMQNAYLQEYGRMPAAAEIAGELGIEQKQLINTLNSASMPISLETPMKAGEDFRLMDIIEDDTQPYPDEHMYQGLLPADIEKALATLTCREAEVLRLYFGLSGRNPLTLSEIGEKFRVTRERARQIKMKALRKLKHRTRSRYLSVYVT